MDHHRPAGPHSCNVGPAAGEGNLRVVVGVGRPDDCHREPMVPVGPHQQFLTGNLLLRVLPVRVPERRGFTDRQVCRRLLVRRRRTDEHELACPALEELQIGRNMVRREGDEINDDVKPPGAERSSGGCRIPNIRDHHFRTIRDRVLRRIPTVQEGQRVPDGDGALRRGSTDHARPTDEKD